MKIYSLSDLHGYLPSDVPECDVVVIAGDILPLQIQSMNYFSKEWILTDFQTWCESLPCRKVFVTPGNHDFCFEDFGHIIENNDKVTILINEGCMFEGLVFYGCPVVEMKTAWAFRKVKYVTYKKLIKGEIDVLICHQPPKYKGLGKIGYLPNKYKQHKDVKLDLGSLQLFKRIKEIKPKLVVCGHIHTGNHDIVEYESIKFINASVKDDNYDVAYKTKLIDINNVKN